MTAPNPDRVYIEPCRHPDSAQGTCIRRQGNDEQWAGKYECPTFCRWAAERPETP